MGAFFPALCGAFFPLFGYYPRILTSAEPIKYFDMSSRKRNRISLSCNYCKQRKVKCDRGKPCGACLKYNVPNECSYPSFDDVKNSVNAATMGQMPLFMVEKTKTPSEHNGAHSHRGSIISNSSSETVDSFAIPATLPDKLVENEVDLLKRKIVLIEQALSSRNGPNSIPGGTFLNEGNRMKQPFGHVITSAPLNGPQTSTSVRKKYLCGNPYDDPQEVYSFYEGVNNLFPKGLVKRQSYGLFSWQAIVSKDSAARMVLEFLSANKNVAVTSKVIRQAKSEIDEDQEKVFKARASRSTVGDDRKIDINPEVKLKLFEGLTTEEKNSKKHETALTLGLVASDEIIDGDLDLATKVLKFLPQKKVVWLLVNKWFTNVYAYMPFIDEESFKIEIARIIGPEDHVMEPIRSLKIDSNLDFAYLGILLVMLRLLYLLLFSNRQEVNELNLKTNDQSSRAQELKLLLSNPISIQTVHMAHACAGNFDLIRKSSILVLQFLYFLRLYHMFGPEEGDVGDGGTSLITHSMLSQSAFHMGLNRDPGVFENDNPNNQKMSNILRKLWFFLIINDIVIGYQHGMPMCISSKHFDTRLPYYERGNENILDIEMEKHVLSTFGYFDKFYIKITNLLDRALDMKLPSTLAVFLPVLDDFEYFIFNTFGKPEDFMVPFKDDNFAYPFMKTMKCKNLLNMNGLVGIILFHLYLHFENKGSSNISAFYLKKILSIFCVSFSPYFYEFISRNHVNFGDCTDLILNPAILAFLHKTSQFTLILLLKVNSSIHCLRNNEKHDLYMLDFDYQTRFQQYCKLSKLVEAHARYVLSAFYRLHNRYYYAWRIAKAHSFLLNLYINDDLYKNCDFRFVEQTFSKISLADINEMIGMFELSQSIVKDRIRQVPTLVESDPKLNAPFLMKFDTPTDISPDSPATVTDPADAQVFQGTMDFNFNPLSNAVDMSSKTNQDVDDLWIQLANDCIKENPMGDNMESAFFQAPAEELEANFFGIINECQFP